MKAIIMNKPGNPDVLQLQDIPKPVINTPSEVLVKLHAAGINPVDAKLRHGYYSVSAFPAILGCEGAGTIEEIGKKVTRCCAGDEVYFFHGGVGGLTGNYAEYIVLDERFVTGKPSSIDFVHAAAAPLVLLTAWEALHDRAEISAGQSVLIHAGAGGVGHVAVQLAKLAGAKVCTTVSSDEKAVFVEKLGADLVINYRNQDFVEEVLKWTNSAGVDIAMDNVGGVLIQDTFPAVKHYGDLVTLLQPAPETDWSVARQRNLRFSFEIMLSPLLHNLTDAQKHQTWILQQCACLFDSNELIINVSKTLPLHQIEEAHKLIETGSTLGKIVLEIC